MLEILSDVQQGTASACADSMTVAGLGTLAASSTSLFASCGFGTAQGLPRFEARHGTCHITPHCTPRIQSNSWIDIFGATQ